MPMRILTGEGARRQLVTSLAPMRRALRGGLGPEGLACLLDGRPVRALPSGAEIVRCLPAGRNDAALRILREVMVEAERDLGDGTARLALAAEAMLREGHRFVTGGLDAGHLADAMERAARHFCERILAEASQDVDLERVALGAGCDALLATPLAQLAQALGPGGRIEFANGEGVGITTRCEAGFVLEAETVSDHLPVPTLADPSVLVADEAIEDLATLLPLLEGFATHGKTLVVLVRGVGGAALQTLHANRRSIAGSIAVLRPSTVGPEAAEILRDAAAATGATVVDDREGSSLRTLRPAMLGRARCAEPRGGTLLFDGPAGRPQDVGQRVRTLRLEAERNRYLSLDRDRLLRRAARLEGRFGEVVLNRRDARETRGRRAVAALLSALESGVLHGGTPTLHRLLTSHPLPKVDDRAATHCLRAALRAWEPRLASAMPPHVCEHSQASFPAIQDPARLTAEILRRATSTASILLRTDAVLCSARN